MDAGERIGQYRILELLGSGAMGEVYKVADEKMFGRIVALKLLSEKLSKNDHARSRFEREVQTAARLEHPGIVTIHDQGDHNGRPYFVMEFLDGSDLTAVIGGTDTRSLERRVEIARQVCEALHFAHEHAVIHRDVKPANIMVIERGGADQAKLVDFGIVHVEDSNLTRAATQPGTYSYMSPEQLRNDPKVDHRSDLFSLGIVLYELFTGGHPFEAASETLITHHILQEEPESPRKRNPGVPSSLEALILRLLEKDPAHRPQTAGEVAEALRQQLRRLQSRWASTDPAEYEDLDEITRDAVEKLVGWARQKESEGHLADALSAYEKASGLAPDSDRIKRKLPKLRHRIESERVLQGHLASAREALRNGDIGAARESWRSAWILSPESEDVAALEIRIQEAETAAPARDERYEFVSAQMKRIEEELDNGRVNDARRHVVAILQRYPDEPLANMALERLLVVAQSGVDYKTYRAHLRAAREALESGRVDDARKSWSDASAMWAGDEEVRALEKEIAARVAAETGALIGRIETELAKADEPDQDDQTALEALAEARRGIDRVGAMGGDPKWIASTRDEVQRIDRAVRERIARAEELRRKQEEEKRRRVESFLQRGRNLLGEAELLAKREVERADQAARAYEQAGEAFSRVLQDDPEHAEAREARRKIENGIRALAEKVERGKTLQVETDALIQVAEERLAAAEDLARGGPSELDGALAALREAELQLERIDEIFPSHEGAAAMRRSITALRVSVLDTLEERERVAAEEEKRRVEAEAAEARRSEEARRAEEAARVAEARRVEDARKAEEAARAAEARRAEDARKSAEAERALAAKKAAKAKKGMEASKPAERREPATESPSTAEVVQAGLRKARHLREYGRRGELRAVLDRLREDVASNPDLASFLPEIEELSGDAGRRKPRRMAVWIGSAAAVLVLAVAAFVFWPTGDPFEAPLAVARGHLDRAGTLPAGTREGLEGARREYREALEIYRGILEKEPGHAAAKQGADLASGRLGDVEAKLGRVAGEEAGRDEARRAVEGGLARLAEAERLLASQPPDLPAAEVAVDEAASGLSLALERDPASAEARNGLERVEGLKDRLVALQAAGTEEQKQKRGLDQLKRGKEALASARPLVRGNAGAVQKGLQLVESAKKRFDAAKDSVPAAQRGEVAAGRSEAQQLERDLRARQDELQSIETAKAVIPPPAPAPVPTPPAPAETVPKAPAAPAFYSIAGRVVYDGDARSKNLVRTVRLRITGGSAPEERAQIVENDRFELKIPRTDSTLFIEVVGVLDDQSEKLNKRDFVASQKQLVTENTVVSIRVR